MSLHERPENKEDACFGWHLAAEGMAAEGLAKQFRQLGVQRGLQVVSVL